LSLNEFLLYFFIFLDFFAFLGWIFEKQEKNKFNEKKFLKLCPCKKMAQNGTLASICTYSAMGGFLYSSTSISLVGFGNFYFNTLFILSLICAFLAWKLKK